MPKPKKGPRLGGSPAHQRLILSNLATQLFEHGRITTTEAKARVLRPVAEKLITKAKRGDLHNRREVLKTIRDKSVVHMLFTEIAPTFAERPGGYTRITKIGPRKGDNAPMAVIELVTEAYEPKATQAGEEGHDPEGRPGRRPRRPRSSPIRSRRRPRPSTSSPPPRSRGSTRRSSTRPRAASSGKYDGSHAPLEDEAQAPEGFPIKGNEDSMKFHEPDGQWFEQTVAEVWFDTVESAEAAGFTRAGE